MNGLNEHGTYDRDRHQRTDNVSVAIRVLHCLYRAVTVLQTNRHLKNYVRQQMINSLIKLFSLPVIHCTPCCHCLPQHPNITTSGVVHTRTLFL